MRVLVFGALLTVAAAAQNILGQPVHVVLQKGNRNAVLQLAPVSLPHQAQQHGQEGSQLKLITPQSFQPQDLSNVRLTPKSQPTVDQSFSNIHQSSSVLTPKPQPTVDQTFSNIHQPNNVLLTPKPQPTVDQSFSNIHQSSNVLTPKPQPTVDQTFSNIHQSTNVLTPKHQPTVEHHIHQSQNLQPTVGQAFNNDHQRLGSQHTNNAFNQGAGHFQQNQNFPSHNRQQSIVVSTQVHNGNQQFGGEHHTVHQQQSIQVPNQFKDAVAVIQSKVTDTRIPEHTIQDNNQFQQTIAVIQTEIKDSSQPLQNTRANVEPQLLDTGSQTVSLDGSAPVTQNIELLEEVNSILEPMNLSSGARLILGNRVSSSFSCARQPFGYYADQENACKVFHVCYPALYSTGRVETYHYSFMCNKGMKFDQEKMTCVRAAEAIPCASSYRYFFKNAEFGLPQDRAILGH